MWLQFWFYCFLYSSSGCFATAVTAVALHHPVCHKYDSCCPVWLVKKVQDPRASLRFLNKQVRSWRGSLKKNWRAPDGINLFSPSSTPCILFFDLVRKKCFPLWCICYTMEICGNWCRQLAGHFKTCSLSHSLSHSLSQMYDKIV